MITVSLCMIVKNEEDTLEKCLRSVEGAVDEIIIVDTGSTDKTKEIASRFTDKIYNFKWIDDFSAARNYSFEKAEKDYLLWLDADDVLLPEDAAKFKKLKETLTPDISAVMMKYNTGFDANGKVTFSYYRERLVKRAGNFKWREPVHEYIDIQGKRITSSICVTHTKKHSPLNDRNIRIYESMLSMEKKLSPRGMYYYARELRDHKRYADAINWFSLFLNLGNGWVEDHITACGELAKCYQAENNPREELSAMLRSFKYDTPRPEICCQLGYYFKRQNSCKQAAFWFELALKSEKDEKSWAFRQEDCMGYIPCIELSVCYDKLGDYEKAASFNELAAGYKPDAPAVLYNKTYFESKLKNNAN